MNDVKGSARPGADETGRIIAEEVGHLLDSPMFMRSPVLSRLLQYLADHRLRGGRVSPKAYAIATEALGRSADFDPAVDSYPRVMVGRLRSLLDRYYSETPWLHRIRVPQGSYEIVVQYRAAPPSSRAGEIVDSAGAETDEAQAVQSSANGESRNKDAERLPVEQSKARALRDIPWRWIGFVVAILLALMAGWWFARSQEGLLGDDFVVMPTIEVSDPAAGETGPSRALARALDGKLRDGFRRFDLVQLLSTRTPRGDAARQRSSDYRLDASLVRTVEGPVDVTLVLNRVADQRAIWSQQIRLAHDDTPQFSGIETAIAQIAGDYGVIVRDQLQREPNNFAAGFPCLAQFNRVRHVRNRDIVRQIDRCLRVSIVEMPQDPVPISALSLLRFSDWQADRATPEGKAAFAEAQNLAQRAYETDPNSSAGLFAMARANFFTGDCQRGTGLGDAAVALNPYDPEIAGFLGLFKVACDRPHEGEALLRRSLALDRTHAGVPAVTLVFLMSQRGEQADALALLDSMPSPSNLEPQYIVARSLVLARMGEMDEAQRLWRRLLQFTKQPPNTPPETVLRQFMINPTVVVRTAAALRQSGVAGVKPSS